MKSIHQWIYCRESPWPWKTLASRRFSMTSRRHYDLEILGPVEKTKAEAPNKRDIRRCHRRF